MFMVVEGTVTIDEFLIVFGQPWSSKAQRNEIYQVWDKCGLIILISPTSLSLVLLFS